MPLSLLPQRQRRICCACGEWVFEGGNYSRGSGSDETAGASCGIRSEKSWDAWRQPGVERSQYARTQSDLSADVADVADGEGEVTRIHVIRSAEMAGASCEAERKQRAKERRKIFARLVGSTGVIHFSVSSVCSCSKYSQTPEATEGLTGGNGGNGGNGGGRSRALVDSVWRLVRFPSRLRAFT